MWTKTFPPPTAFKDVTKLPSYAFSFVLSNLEGIRLPFFLLTLVRVLSTLLKFYTAYILGEIITAVATITTTDIVWFYCPLLFGLFVVKEVTDYFTRKYAESLPAIYGDFIQQRFLLTLFPFSSPSLFNYSKERLGIVIGRYVDHSRRFISDWVWSITGHAVTLVVVAVILYQQSLWVFLINCSYVVLFLTLAFRLSKKFSHLASSLSDAQIDAGALYQNAFLSYNFLSRLNLEKFISEMLTQRFHRSWSAVEKVQSFHAYRWLIQLNIFNTLYVGTLCYGLYQVKLGLLPLGFLVLIKWSFDNLWNILVYIIEYYVQLVQQQEDVKILRREMKLFLPSQPFQLISTKSDQSEKLSTLEWRDVHIALNKDTTTFTLSIPSCVIQRGENVGVRGGSGSGKSTFFATLFGTIPYTGALLYNGKPYDWRSASISSMSGSDPLLKISLRDNLLLGKEIAPLVLEQILKGCCIDEFCTNLDQIVGSSSFNLSSGQEQRVRIARTLLHGGACFVFDEPFNGIDKETKLKIKNFLAEFLKEKTVLISSHIPEDLDWCDRFLSVRDGAVLAE
jgi:ABC-type bacteriocin/lantibiotic exporter with double-glycine peptidase domain